MQVEQTNLWENVAHHAGREKSSMAIAAYQANMPTETGVFGVGQEQYARQTAGVSDGSIDMATYSDPTKSEHEETVAEQLSEESASSAEARRNEVAVVANTTTEEDLQKMEEDGFSLTESDSRTIITVTDKIKATLAEAGVDISYMGGGLSKEELSEITGNPAVTQQILSMLSAYDLPATKANVEDCADALTQAASVSEVTPEAMAYLLKNEKAPSIQNLYMASFSGSAEQIVAPSDSGIDFDALLPQMEAIAADAGLSEDADAMENSKWLVANDIPLTAENLQLLTDLQELSADLESGDANWDALLSDMAKTITDGGRPLEASMLTARRKLEETRLVMTSESGAAMEKAGVEMDLAPIEATVADLKEQERSFYRDLFSGAGVESPEEKANLAVETQDVFAALKQQPAVVLGQVEADDSVRQIYDAGASLQRTLEQANERYETLMTSPRADMGDSIQKAFSNVDEILTDMGLETTPANERAVRILAYNSTPLSEENITEIKALDEQMQRAFTNMKPAVTMELIKRGENPLDMSMEELNTAAQEIREEIGDGEQERFSKYLWKLEQNSEISEEERSSYIGIYRLIAQVEKDGGAALGFLMNQRSDVTMRNLLSAVRSAKKTGMDYQVDDSVDGVEATGTGARIDDQINAAFTQNCLRDVMENLSPEKLKNVSEGWQEMTPEQLAQALEAQEDSDAEQQAMKEYRQAQLASYQQTVTASDDIYAYLERYGVTNSMTNIMAASEMLRTPNRMMERLFRENRFSLTSQEKIADLKQQLLEDFSEALKNPSELADAQETLAEVAEHVMDGMIIEDPQTRVLDLRAMRQTMAQFTLCAQKTEEECYMVPVQTGDSVTGVSLKIVRGKKQKGFVDIFFDTQKAGRVTASFQAKEEGISGILATDDEETAKLLSAHTEELAQAMGESADLRVVHTTAVSFRQFEMAGLRREQAMEDRQELAEDRSDAVQTTRLYHIAESFIQTVKEIAS